MNDPAKATSTLIRTLAMQAAPVTPLASPMRRTVGWLTFAFSAVAAMVLVLGFRQDLRGALTAPWAAIELLASVCTGIAAACAAFQVSVPGRSRRWAWLPVPFLLAWLGGLGWGCVSDAARLGPAAFAMHAAVGECARAIAFMSLPLLAGLLWMVRHAAAAGPAPSAWLAMLSAAALSSAGVTLIHPGETAWMVVIWHFVAVILLSLLCLACSRALFAWIAPGKPRVHDA